MLHRLVAMAAAGTMLMSVAACGSSSDDNAATSNSSDTSLISVNNSEPQNGLIPSDTKRKWAAARSSATCSKVW